MTSIEMDDLTFELINGPLVIFNILANGFYAFCLFWPFRGRENIKQPLKMLLGSLVFCTMIFLLALIVDQCVWLLQGQGIRYFNEIVSFTASISMSTSVWLNFFYYTQIVPSQEVIFICVKRNIKIIMYCVLFVDRVFFLFDLSVNLSCHYIWENDTSAYTSLNDNSGLYYTFLVCSFSKIIYVFLCLCLMMGSSCATARYLHRHIMSMEQCESPFSPHLASQVRITVTGIMHGFLYLLCALWIFTYFFTYFLPPLAFGYNVYFTAISFYMFGTTVILGTGQCVFRQRSADTFFHIQKAVRSLRLCAVISPGQVHDTNGMA